MEKNKLTNLDVMDFAMTEKGTPLKVKTRDNNGQAVWSWLANGDDRFTITDNGVYPYRGGVIEVDVSGGSSTQEFTAYTNNTTIDVPSGLRYDPINIALPMKTLENETALRYNGTYTPTGTDASGHAYQGFSKVVVNVPPASPTFSTNPPSSGGYSFNYTNMITNFFNSSFTGEVEGYITYSMPNLGGADSGVMFNTQTMGSPIDNSGIFASNTVYGKVGMASSTVPSNAAQIMSLVEHSSYVAGSSDPSTQYSKYVGYYLNGASTDSSDYFSNYSDMSYLYRGHPLYEWLFDTDLSTYGYIDHMAIGNTNMADVIVNAHGYGIKAIHIHATGLPTQSVFSYDTTSGIPYFTNFDDLECLYFTLNAGGIRAINGTMFSSIPHLKMVYLDIPTECVSVNVTNFLAMCPDLSTIHTPDTESYNAWYDFFTTNNMLTQRACLVSYPAFRYNWLVDPTGLNNSVWYNRNTGLKVTL